MDPRTKRFFMRNEPIDLIVPKFKVKCFEFNSFFNLIELK